MGIITAPHPVKLFIGMLSGDISLFDEISDMLSTEYGPVDINGPVWPWRFTQYYEKEMGDNLKRKFIFFQDLISPGDISAIKIRTNELEQQYLDPAVNRLINLDPGYLDSAKLVLVSSKDFSHRIYLKDGIYGETTLIFAKGDYRLLPYTYPDYASSEYLELFRSARGIFHSDEKSRAHSE